MPTAYEVNPLGGFLQGFQQGRAHKEEEQARRQAQDLALYKQKSQDETTSYDRSQDALKQKNTEFNQKLDTDRVDIEKAAQERLKNAASLKQDNIEKAFSFKKSKDFADREKYFFNLFAKTDANPATAQANAHKAAMDEAAQMFGVDSKDIALHPDEWKQFSPGQYKPQEQTGAFLQHQQQGGLDPNFFQQQQGGGQPQQNPQQQTQFQAPTPTALEQQRLAGTAKTLQQIQFNEQNDKRKIQLADIGIQSKTLDVQYKKDTLHGREKGIQLKNDLSELRKEALKVANQYAPAYKEAQLELTHAKIAQTYANKQHTEVLTQGSELKNRMDKEIVAAGGYQGLARVKYATMYAGAQNAIASANKQLKADEDDIHESQLQIDTKMKNVPLALQHFMQGDKPMSQPEIDAYTLQVDQAMKVPSDPKDPNYGAAVEAKKSALVAPLLRNDHLSHMANIRKNMTEAGEVKSFAEGIRNNSFKPFTGTSYVPLPKHGTDRAIGVAEQWLGKPYLWGGDGTGANKGIDCSHLVGAAYPFLRGRTADEQYKHVNHIDGQDLQKGDLVVEYNPIIAKKRGDPARDWTHIGIYDGSGSVIEAGSAGVKRTPIDSYLNRTGVTNTGFGRPTQEQMKSMGEVPVGKPGTAKPPNSKRVSPEELEQRNLQKAKRATAPSGDAAILKAALEFQKIWKKK